MKLLWSILVGAPVSFYNFFDDDDWYEFQLPELYCPDPQPFVKCW